MVVLGLCCCMRAFFNCDERGLLSNCSTRASLVSGHGLRNTGSVVVPVGWVGSLHVGPSQKVKVLLTQSCPTLCDLMDCNLPGSSVHRIFLTRILKWVAISFSRGSSWPRDWNWVSYIAGRLPTKPPDQGSNPCPLNWQADSQPLDHQGSPFKIYFT